MALRFDTSHEGDRIYSGRCTEQMSFLISGGMTPISVAQSMRRRLDLRNSRHEIRADYIDNYIDTGDAIVSHPDGRLKIILDSQHLREITAESEIDNGAFVLSHDSYRALQGEEFRNDKLDNMGLLLSREQVKSHPIWQFLARDRSLLNDYADFIFAEGEKDFTYDLAMGVYTCSAGGNAPEIRNCSIGGIGDLYSLDFRASLNGRGGRFIGVFR